MKEYIKYNYLIYLIFILINIECKNSNEKINYFSKSLSSGNKDNHKITIPSNVKCINCIQEFEKKLQINKNKVNIIIFHKKKCRACLTFIINILPQLCSKFNQKKIINFYLIDIECRDGEKFINNYHLSSVPTIIICENKNKIFKIYDSNNENERNFINMKNCINKSLKIVTNNS